MSKAFSGVRVVDFTQVLSGPFATQQLAFLGADIVKVEQPGSGDQGRDMLTAPGVLEEARLSPLYTSVNSGKRSLTLDLKKPEAGEVVRRLIADADVLVQNFKAGTMERMGFGWDAARAINPRLVYCAISGFGQTGPKAPSAAYDPVIQAASGMMSITGHPETGPVKTGYWVTDMATGITAAFAISAALFRRERTGEGQYLDVSMLDTAVSFLGPIISNYVNGGVAPGLFGNASQARSPISDMFPTGRGWLLIAAAVASHWPALCRALERPDLAEDPRFATRDLRRENGPALREELVTTLARHDAGTWETRIAAAGVPCGAVQTIPEALDSPQVLHRELLTRMPGPPGVGREIAVVGAPYKLDRDGPGTDLPPPLVGQHTDEILSELGFAEVEVRTLRQAGAV